MGYMYTRAHLWIDENRPEEQKFLGNRPVPSDLDSPTMHNPQIDLLPSKDFS